MSRTLLAALFGASTSLVVIAGCSAPIPEGRFACVANNDCPPGLMCASDGLCRTGGGTVDSGIDAARADTGSADTGVDGGPITADVGVDTGIMPVDGGSDSGCATNAACDDGRFCNGPEQCVAGACGPGTLPCTGSETCDEGTHMCTMATCTTDADGDGFVASSCGGPDCNDSDRNIHPGQRELCDGIDNDCTGGVDDNAANNCPGHIGTMASCTAARCGYSCVSNLLTCDTSDPGDVTGCEVDPSRDTNNCGSCMHMCPAGANQTATCSPAGASGTCSVACMSGYLDCDGLTSTGCETRGSTCDLDPRLIGPLDEMVVSSNHPTFRFAPAAGTTDAHVEVCMDEACATVVATLDGPSPLTLSTPLGPGHYFWRAHGRSGTWNGPRATFAWGFGTMARTSTTAPSADVFPYLDIDHGMPDLVVGAPTPGAGGMVRLYLGAAPGVGVIAGATGAGGFGSATAAAGDVNGDGFGDVVVGACIGIWNDSTMPTPSTGCGSQAFMMMATGTGTLGAPLPFSPGAVTSFGNAVSAAGDFNGDGYGDIVVGAYFAGHAYIYRGSASGLDMSAPSSVLGVGGGQFGASVSFAGDVNADGFDDVVVGQPGLGRAFLYLGQAASGVPVEIQFGPGAGTMGYGSSVTGLGDFNGDGYPDFAVATYGGPGMVEIRLGAATVSATAPPAVFTSFMIPGMGSTGGASISGFGDCNGDGLGDLATGSFQGGSFLPGTVAAFHGGATAAASGMIASVMDTSMYYGRVVSRLAGPTITTAACSATGACAQRVYEYGCTTGSLSQIQLWTDSSVNFGAGLMR